MAVPEMSDKAVSADSALIERSIQDSSSPAPQADAARLIYPKDTCVHWRGDIPARPGAQTGVLAQDWQRFVSFPVVRWDGEDVARMVLPECLAPINKPVASVSLRDAWKAGAR